MKKSVLKVLSVMFCMIVALSLVVIPVSADTPSLENYRYKTTIEIHYPYLNDPGELDFPFTHGVGDVSSPLYYVVYDPDDLLPNGRIVLGLCDVRLFTEGIDGDQVVVSFTPIDSTAKSIRFIFSFGDVTCMYGDDVYDYDVSQDWYLDLYSLDNTFLPYVDSTAFDWYSVISIDAPVNLGMTDKWTDIMTWVTDSLGSVQSVFFADGELTFIGTLAVVGVAIAVAFLIIGVVQKFLTLR